MFRDKKLERIAKGFANHRRIAMLQLLKREPELSLQDISEKLKVNYKTTSMHLYRLAIAGLILKQNKANNVLHKLSPRGESVLKFLRNIE